MNTLPPNVICPSGHTNPDLISMMGESEPVCGTCGLTMKPMPIATVASSGTKCRRCGARYGAPHPVHCSVCGFVLE